MSPHDLHDDDALLRALAEALRSDTPDGEVPADALAAARSVAGLDRIDDLLAEVAFDSLDGAAVLVRAAAAPARMLSFAADGVTVDVELSADGREVVGAVDPPVPGHVRIEAPGGEGVDAPLDTLGRFRAAVPAGPVRFRLPTTPPVVTPWVTR